MGARVAEVGQIPKIGYVSESIMFRGNYDHTIDRKGRLSIPARFRDVLTSKNSNHLMVTNFVVGGERCLEVYPIDEWSRLEESVNAKPQFDDRVLKFQSYYLARAVPCELDAHGRILIPPALREYAELKRDVVVVSALVKFRLWDREKWQKIFDEAENTLVQDAHFLRELGI